MKTSKIIASDFLDDLSSPYARRWLVAGFSLLIVIFLGLTLWLKNGTDLSSVAVSSVAASVMENALANAVIILSAFVLYYYFIGVRPPALEATRPQDIKLKLRSLIGGASYYIFWGRSGSYFRVCPLAELDRIAKSERRTINIEVLLPNPLEERLCHSYRDILSTMNEEHDGNPLLANVLATSICCALIASNNRFLTIRLYYSNFLPAFRVDISDNGTVITQDDPAKAALSFEGGTEFSEMMKTTIRNEIVISKEASWDETKFKGKTLNADLISEEIFQEFGFTIDATVRDRVIDLVSNPRHRYQ